MKRYTLTFHLRGSRANRTAEVFSDTLTGAETALIEWEGPNLIITSAKQIESQSVGDSLGQLVSVYGN